MSISDFTEDGTFGDDSSSPIYDLAVDPNRPYILALRYSGDVGVYNKDDYTHVATISGSSSPPDSVDQRKFDIGPTGDYLLATTDSSSCRIFDISDSDPTNWSVNRTESLNNTGWAMAVHGSEQWAVFAQGSNGYEVYDYSGGGWSNIQSSNVTATCFEFDSTGTYMARGAASDTYIYDVRPSGSTWDQIATLSGHSGQSNGIRFGPNQSYVVVGTVEEIDIFSHGSPDGSGWGSITSLDEVSNQGDFASTGEYYLAPSGFTSASDVGVFEPNNGWNLLGEPTPSAVSGPIHSVDTFGSRMVFADAGDSANGYVMNMPVSVQIDGQVTLENSPVEGAKVYLINDSNDSLAQTTTTDANGEYAFEVESGTLYHIGVEYQRYE